MNDLEAPVLFGENVAKLRNARGWTQGQLELYSGVSQAHISQIESGARPNPSIDVSARIAAALGVPINALVNPDFTDEIANAVILEQESLRGSLVELFDSFDDIRRRALHEVASILARFGSYPPSDKPHDQSETPPAP